MARHALGSGVTVPAWVLGGVERSRVAKKSEPGDADRSLQSADPYESGEWDVTSLTTHLRDQLKSGESSEQAEASVEKLLTSLAPHETGSDSGGADMEQPPDEAEEA